MQIAHGSGGLHLHIDQPAQADAEGGHAFGVHGGIGDERDIGGQALGIFGDEPGDGSAAHLFFAFDDKADVHGQLAGG